MVVKLMKNSCYFYRRLGGGEDKRILLKLLFSSEFLSINTNIFLL